MNKASGILRLMLRPSSWLAGVTVMALLPAVVGGAVMAAGTVSAWASVPSLVSTAPRCSLNTIYSVDGESGAVEERQTASWSLLQANGWTVIVPNGSWHLSASDAGADVLSPDGRSDASLATWYSLDHPWSMATLGHEILGSVSDIRVICRSALERDSEAATQATELTGVYRGEPIHAVVILSLMTQTQPGLFIGETRSLYTATSQWSPAYETALMLIIRRAIVAPQSLNG